MSRRNIELMLLCVAAPLVLLLFAMVALNNGGTLVWENFGVPIGMFVCFVVAHIAIRFLAPGADPAILPISFALSGIGIAFITRLDPGLASRQVIWLFVGVICLVLTLVILRKLDKVANYKYTLMIFGFVLLLSPLLPLIGAEQYGSRIWLSLGGFSFQPGEIAKILIVLFLAGYLAQNREMLSSDARKIGPIGLPDLPTLLPLLIMWAISMLIVVFEKDLGSAIVVFLVFLTMLYVASGKKLYLVVGFVFVGLGFVACYLLFSHVQTRVDIWLDPFSDPTNKGYQLVQSLYSLADGGLFGVGVGSGLAEKIPIVESDFIFACIGEEAGLLGAAGVLLLYLCFAIRGMVTAARAKSDVSSFIAVGLTSIIILQAFIIVGGVTGLIPLTGLTLPFVSQGGSSLLASFIVVGMLLRCGDESKGMQSELISATTQFSAVGKHGGTAITDAAGVLGRIALGKRLTGVMVVFALLIAALIANLTMVMVVNANEYQNMPSNNHTLAKETKTERGTISTSDGTVLAQSVLQPDGTYKRTYPAGTLASHVVGYASQTYGTAGIEAACNDTLKGERNYASWADVINSATGNGSAGNDVKLTINASVQRAAEKALTDYKGACIVMNPETGAVLALASSPSYNVADVEKVLASSDSSNSSLYNRATTALYAPGSTFKTVSLTTAIEDGIASENDKFDAPASIDIGNAEVTNMHKASYGTISLARATEVSSNTVYGQLGSRIGPQKLVDGAKAFGFGNTIDFDLPVTTSVMPDPKEMTEWETAWAACGVPVGEHQSAAGPQTTVMQMALVGSAIANDGVIQKPYLVESIYSPNGDRSYTAASSTYATACSVKTAQRVKSVLEGVVEHGTGTRAQVSGVTIAGKTGTAETGKAKDDSWFVGMGPSEDCKVVIAIVLEESGSGVAASRSASVLKTALSVQGVL